MDNYNSFIDVHTFDGRWKIKKEVKSRITIEDKHKLLRWFLEKVENVTDDDGKKGLQLVINDTQNINNYDSKNLIYADDILGEIFLELLKKDDIEDYCKILLEQMRDMYLSGRCPQGRTTRLIQVYISLF